MGTALPYALRLVTMPQYDVKQVSEIATTILGYEKDRHGRNTQGAHQLAKVRALATGTAEAELGWWENVEHGALPLELHPKPDHEHPLEFVAVFEDDEEVRDAFVDWLRKAYAIEENEEDTPWRHIKTTTLPPPPGGFDKFDRVLRQFFHPSHAAWYTPQVMRRMAEEELITGYDVGRFLGLCAESLERAGESVDILRNVALRAVQTEVAKKARASTNYASISEAISLANQPKVQDLLMQNSGVLQVLLITLRASSQAAMIRGLRAVATNRRYDITQRFGRVPTFEEITASNVKGAAEMWHKMPWEILQPLVKKHGDQLRASLLKRTDFPYEKYKEVFTDHEGRFKLKSSSELEIDDVYTLQAKRSPFGSSNRLEMLRGRGAFYRRAVALREALRKDYPVEVAQLICLRHLDNRAALGAYIEPILTDRVRAALTKYGSPGNSG